MLPSFAYNRSATTSRRERLLPKAKEAGRRAASLQVVRDLQDLRNLQATKNQAVDLDNPQDPLPQWLNSTIRYLRRRSSEVQTPGWSNFIHREYLITDSVRPLQKFWAIIQQATRLNWQASAHISNRRQPKPAIHGQIPSERIPNRSSLWHLKQRPTHSLQRRTNSRGSSCVAQDSKH